jgi:hypothetical protein
MPLNQPTSGPSGPGWLVRSDWGPRRSGVVHGHGTVPRAGAANHIDALYTTKEKR